MTIPYRNYFKKISTALQNVLSSDIKSKGFTDARIILHWVDIVGEDIAKQCVPSHVSKGSTGRECILWLKGDDLSIKFQFQYLKSTIAKRIELYLGNKIFTDIKMIR
jgi:hypothetical protein